MGRFLCFFSNEGCQRDGKGMHLLRADEWKEKFLTSIKDNYSVEQLFKNKKYAVWGLPFYNSEQRGKEFTEAFDGLLE